MLVGMLDNPEDGRLLHIFNEIKRNYVSLPVNVAVRKLKSKTLSVFPTFF